MTALNCEFVKSDLGFGLGSNTGLGIFRAKITIGDLTECGSYSAQTWQGYTARSFVCFAAIFGGLALAELSFREFSIGSLGSMAGPGFLILAMIGQGLTFLFLFDRISLEEVDLGLGGIFSIVSASSFLVATCASCGSSDNSDEEEG